MNLIFQGSTDRATIDRLSAPSRPARIEQIHAHAWRCIDVTDSPAVRSQIEEDSLQARLDATFIVPGRQLADFGLLAMDMDSTVITIECIDEIADMQGLKPQVAAITEAAMRGEIEFAESLTRRVALLEGLDAGALQKVYDERLKFSPGAEALISAAHAAGVKTLLVSGGFTFFTDRVRQRLHLDYSHANVLEVVDGRLTGKVVGGIVDAEEKKRTVERVCAELGIPTRQAIVMGDGANDLKMMSVAGLSVAYRAKPVVRAQADVALNFSGLDGILALLAQ
ncbi:phosphoserine phosphatase SerB|uniref:phosphoserine phosphatase SerB n=1 Tax=Noviherbaspirillum sp. L7-7A TaxID=2850560 RepID=UPI001C2BD792|nr:phosphoserine phosphatase SerB [Noviherbaspirillum sp. L7-7A]MBV0879044.1 phosphoserine phosphatase SerB [Noviherbaspirillum sp. L7-7A]